jgi:hypothetical protein
MLLFIYIKVGSGRSGAVPFDASKVSHLKTIADSVDDKNFFLLNSLPDDILLMPVTTTCCGIVSTYIKHMISDMVLLNLCVSFIGDKNSQCYQFATLIYI